MLESLSFDRVDWQVVCSCFRTGAEVLGTAAATVVSLWYVVWPSLRATARRLSAVARGLAATFRRKPDPELVALAFSVAQLVESQKAQSNCLMALVSEFGGTQPKLEVVSDTRRSGTLQKGNL